MRVSKIVVYIPYLALAWTTPPGAGNANFEIVATERGGGSAADDADDNACGGGGGSAADDDDDNACGGGGGSAADDADDDDDDDADDDDAHGDGTRGWKEEEGEGTGEMGEGRRGEREGSRIRRHKGCNVW